MAKYFLEYQYNDRGRGQLKLHNDSLLAYEIEARTGSINKAGRLVNNIRPGVWSITSKSVETTEKPMRWEDKEGYGWKIRMNTPEGMTSRYLIHPDGGKGGRGNGTAGCIGTQGNAFQLRFDLDKILDTQDDIEVYVNTPIPKD
jgi:hypothetical protein